MRHGAPGPELLVFEYPEADVQLPKGGIEPGEHPEAAAVRELEEETGMTDAGPPRHLATWDRPLDRTARPAGSGTPAPQRWEIFLLDAPADTADEWTHQATGSVEEEGLTFRCHWIPLDDRGREMLHPWFGPVFDLVRRAVEA